MFREDDIILGGTSYQILYFEHDHMFHPEYFGISPTWSDDEDFAYYCTFELKEYQLYLKDLIVSSDRNHPVINGVSPKPFFSESNIETVQYIDINEPIEYSGAIIIGNQFLNDYDTDEKLTCFCYKYVRELFLQEGKLVTSIDHSKAMVRIRKNIDSGLRSLDKPKDVKCIERFLKTSFAGDYDKNNKSIKRKLERMLHTNSYISRKHPHKLFKD